MDHTLALYKKRPIEELAFRSTVSKLVKRPGYPASLANIPYDPEACVRGLIVDRDAGNILKLDKHTYIADAYHGMRPLSHDEIEKRYPEQILKFDPNKHYSVDTLFSIPEVYLYEKLVDFIDNKTVKGKNYAAAFVDVRACIDESHRDGSIKSRVREKVGDYIDDDPNLPLTLHKFRAAGKKLFLLTNSDFSYVDLILWYLLNRKLPQYPSWKDYFDLVITEAGKPGFYKRPEPMVPLENKEDCKIFKGGSARELEQRIGVSGGRVLYFGDHTYDDILRTKRQFNWRTAMIVPGLAAEIKIGQKEGRLRAELFKLFQERDSIYLKITKHYSGIARIRTDKIHNFHRKNSAELVRMDAHTAEIFKEINRLERKLSNVMIHINALNRALFRRYNKYWGSEFASGNEIS